jgi:hypothetical protein
MCADEVFRLHFFPSKLRQTAATTPNAGEGQGEIDSIEILARAICAAGPMHRVIRGDLGFVLSQLTGRGPPQFGYPR